MIRVFALFLLTAAAFGLVAFTAAHPEVWEPWLDAQGITRDDRMFRSIVKVFVTLVVGIPLGALIFAIRRLGSDRTQQDIHGYTVLRLKAGSRWFAVFSLIGLAALFFAYPAVDPQAPVPWAFQAVGVSCLLGILVILKAKIRYDGTTLIVSNSFGGHSTHQWSDLAAIREVPEMKHYVFSFRDGKKAKISDSYAGIDTFLEAAQSKLNAYAAPPAGRNAVFRT